jgi:hypothetical protein
MRLIAVVLASAVATVSCKSNEAQPAVAPAGSAAAGSAVATKPEPGSGAGSGSAVAAAPAGSAGLVQAWAPKDSKVAPADIKLPGVELFVVTGGPVADGEYGNGTLVGVAGGKVVEGRELVLGVIAAKAAPKLIAQIALWVAQRDSDGTILDAAATQQQRKAKASGPAVKSGQLVFWVQTTEEPRMLEVGKVNLATGLVEIAAQPMPHDAAVNLAIATLGGGGVSRYGDAIQTLVAACSEAKPRQALLTALARHPRDRTRAAIANQVYKCGASAVAPLINLMEDDKSALVRSEAANALGKAGDSRARPALAKAARGEDANLAWAAKNALGKLK